MHEFVVIRTNKPAGSLLIHEGRNVVDVARQAGHAPTMTLNTYAHVFDEFDLAERISAELAWAARRGPVAFPANLASRLSVKAELIPVVLRRLGFRILPAGSLDPDQYGPPAPAMILPIRRARPAPAPRQQVAASPPAGPFAALASLRLRAGAV